MVKVVEEALKVELEGLSKDGQLPIQGVVGVRFRPRGSPFTWDWAVQTRHRLLDYRHGWEGSMRTVGRGSQLVDNPMWKRRE